MTAAEVEHVYDRRGEVVLIVPRSWVSLGILAGDLAYTGDRVSLTRQAEARLRKLRKERALVDVLTGVADGSRIERIRIVATGTTTAGMVRLFLFDGTNNRLWREVSVTAATPSATVQAFSAEIARGDGQPVIQLPTASWVLRAATNNAETFNVFAEIAGDLTA